jgi:hypothetical protein
VGWRTARWNRSRNWRPDATLFDLLARHTSDASSLVEASEIASNFGRRLEAFAAARETYLRGLRLDADGQTSPARDAFVESARLSGDFTTSYAHVITLAVQISRENPPEARRLLDRLIEARPEQPVAGQLRERLFPPGSRTP